MYEIVGYNSQDNEVHLSGPAVSFHLPLTDEILARNNLSIVKEDGSHAELEELQAQLQAGV